MLGRTWGVAGFILVGASQAAVFARMPQSPAVVIFTGNIAGNLHGCDCDGAPAGGMTRLRAIIDSLRARHPRAVLVDTGDLFSSYARRENDEALAAAAAAMRYDAIAMGEYEWTYGAQFLQQMKEKYGLPFVSLNLHPGTWASRAIRIARRGYEIRIIAVTDTALFRYRQAPRRPDRMQEWDQAIALVALDREIPVFIFHGDESMLARAVAQTPAGALLLQGHWHRRFTPLEDGVRRFGNRLVFTAGGNGEYVGIALREEGERHWRVTLIRVDGQNNAIRLQPPMPKTR